MPAYHAATDPAVLQEFAPRLLHTLSPRRQEIYRLRALAWTHVRIATFLRLSLSTVEKESRAIQSVVRSALQSAREDSDLLQAIAERQIRLGHTIVESGEIRFKPDIVALAAYHALRQSSRRAAS